MSSSHLASTMESFLFRESPISTNPWVFCDCLTFKREYREKRTTFVRSSIFFRPLFACGAAWWLIFQAYLSLRSICALVWSLWRLIERLKERECTTVIYRSIENAMTLAGWRRYCEHAFMLLAILRIIPTNEAEIRLRLICPFVTNSSGRAEQVGWLVKTS